MSLKKRLIPTLLLRNGRMVKGVQFSDYRDVGHPVTTARIYDAQGADELVFLDITVPHEEQRALYEIISLVADECFMPLAVGGGVRRLEDFRKLLQVGADKVSINTAAVETPHLITEAARLFGSQCVVVSVDVKTSPAHRWEVFTHSGQKATGLDGVEWAKKAASLGAGEILLTSIDHEGTRKGYDLDLIRAVSEAVGIPVIAHGGAGELQHFLEGLTRGLASAVAAASLFHFSDQSVIKAKTFMKYSGVNVRWPV